MNLIGHRGLCTPDLTGLKINNLTPIKRGKDYIAPGDKYSNTTWDCVDLKGCFHPAVRSCAILHGESQGIIGPKGGGFLDTNGYVQVQIHGKRIRAHRLIMSKILGRSLRPDETVHHGPKGRACNDPENLSIRLKGKHPAGYSEQELAEWLQSLGWNNGQLIKPPARLAKKSRRRAAKN